MTCLLCYSFHIIFLLWYLFFQHTYIYTMNNKVSHLNVLCYSFWLHAWSHVLQHGNSVKVHSAKWESWTWAPVKAFWKLEKKTKKRYGHCVNQDSSYNTYNTTLIPLESTWWKDNKWSKVLMEWVRKLTIQYITIIFLKYIYLCDSQSNNLKRTNWGPNWNTLVECRFLPDSI